MEYRVQIVYDQSTDEDMVLVTREEGGRCEYAKVEWLERSRGVPTEPTFKFWSEGPRRNSFLSSFVDAAWEFGVRPVQIEDQRNQVKAMESHLGDLRKVSFKLLKIDEGA